MNHNYQEKTFEEKYEDGTHFMRSVYQECIYCGAADYQSNESCDRKHIDAIPPDFNDRGKPVPRGGALHMAFEQGKRWEK